jgi:hypothetical protein
VVARAVCPSPDGNCEHCSYEFTCPCWCLHVTFISSLIYEPKIQHTTYPLMLLLHRQISNVLQVTTCSRTCQRSCKR